MTEGTRRSVTQVTVHCFFGCGAAVHDESQRAHDAMERHYRERHQKEIEEALR